MALLYLKVEFKLLLFIIRSSNQLYNKIMTKRILHERQAFKKRVESGQYKEAAEMFKFDPYLDAKVETEDLIQLYLNMDVNLGLSNLLMEKLDNFHPKYGNLDAAVIRYLTEEVVLDMAIKAKQSLSNPDKNVIEANKRILNWSKDKLKNEYYRLINGNQNVIYKGMPEAKRLEVFDEEWIANQLEALISPENKDSKDNKYNKIQMWLEMLPEENIMEVNPINPNIEGIYNAVIDFCQVMPITDKAEYCIKYLSQRRYSTREYISNLVNTATLNSMAGLNERDNTLKKLRSCMCNPPLALKVIQKIAREGRPLDIAFIDSDSQSSLARKLEGSQYILHKYSYDDTPVERYDDNSIEEFKNLSLIDAIKEGFKAIVQLKLKDFSDKQLHDLLLKLDPLNPINAVTADGYFKCLNLILGQVKDKSIIAGYLSAYTYKKFFSSTVASCLINHLNDEKALQNEKTLRSLSQKSEAKRVSLIEVKKLIINEINHPSRGFSNEHILYPFRKQLYHDCILDGMKKVIKACAKPSKYECFMIGKKEDKLQKLMVIKDQYEHEGLNCKPENAQRIIDAFCHVAGIARGISEPTYSKDFKQLVHDLKGYDALNRNEKDVIIEQMESAIHRMMNVSRTNSLKEKFYEWRGGAILDKSKELYRILDAFKVCKDNEIKQYYDQFSERISRKRGATEPSYATEFKNRTKYSIQDIIKDIPQSTEDSQQILKHK